MNIETARFADSGILEHNIEFLEADITIALNIFPLFLEAVPAVARLRTGQFLVNGELSLIYADL